MHKLPYTPSLFIKTPHVVLVNALVVEQYVMDMNAD